MDGRHARREKGAWGRAWPVAIALATMLTACGGGGGATDDAPPLPDRTEATIDAAGGRVTGPSGATVTVPAGALEQATTIRIAKDSTDAPPLPPGLTVAGDVYAITPHGATFGEPVEVRIPLPSVTLQPDQSLVMAKGRPGGGWELVPTTSTGGWLTTRVTSFSYFAGVIVTYPQSLLQAVAYDVTTRLDCEPGCLRNVGPVTWTLSWQPNGGVLPSTCQSPAIGIVVSAAGANETLTFPYDQAGSVTRTAAFEPATGIGIRSRLFCANSSANVALREDRTITWVQAGRYPAVTHVRSPAQLDVVAGTPAELEVLFTGGASSPGRAQPPGYRPVGTTEFDRAVIDWERSADGGASWQLVGRSYENEADRRPLGALRDWVYWAVRFGFTRSAIVKKATP